MIIVKNWSHFLKISRSYDYIVISGPQRSGTTYVTKELANELKYRHVDEFKHGISQFDKMMTFIGKVPSVIQAPALCHKLHEINYKKTLIVFMLRNNEDIKKSEDRINWHKKYADKERFAYITQFPKHKDRLRFFKRSAPMKKWAWKRIQRRAMQVDFLQLPFDFISQSKGFVKKEDRINFGKKQTE